MAMILEQAGGVTPRVLRGAGQDRLRRESWLAGASLAWRRVLKPAGGEVDFHRHQGTHRAPTVAAVISFRVLAVGWAVGLQRQCRSGRRGRLLTPRRASRLADQVGA